MGLYRAQFISMIIMIAIGTGVFLGFNIEWRLKVQNNERVQRNFACRNSNGRNFCLHNQSKSVII